MSPRLVGPASASSKIIPLLSQGKPQDAVAEFQNLYGLAVPCVNAVYPLLDQSGYARREVHSRCLDAVKRRLLEKIKTSNVNLEMIKHIAEDSLKYVHMPQLREVVMAILGEHPDAVSETVWDKLIENLELFREAPIKAKRALWIHHPLSIQTFIAPLLTTYMLDPELRAASRELVIPCRGETDVELEEWSPGGAAAAEGVRNVGLVGRDIISVTRVRRAHPIIQNLFEGYGDNMNLYRQIIEVIRIGFNHLTEEWGLDYTDAIGTLRADMVMLLHQSHFDHVQATEETHKLVWNMDACVRSGELASTRVQDLKANFFDQLSIGSNIYGDIAMILLDCHTVNMLARNILSCVTELAPHVSKGKDRLQKTHLKMFETISWSSTLMHLGRNAKNMFDTGVFRAPKVEKAIFDEFYYGGLCSLILQDVEREERRQQSFNEGSGTNQSLLHVPPDLLSSENYYLLGSSEIAMKVYLQYMLSRVLALDTGALRRSLPALLPGAGPAALSGTISDSFWQSMVSVLLRPRQYGHLLNDAAYRRACIDDGLFVVARTNVFATVQMTRLCLEVLDGAASHVQHGLDNNGLSLDDANEDDVEGQRLKEKKNDRAKEKAAELTHEWAGKIVEEGAKPASVEETTLGDESSANITFRRLLSGYLHRACLAATKDSLPADTSERERAISSIGYRCHPTVALYLDPNAGTDSKKRDRPEGWEEPDSKARDVHMEEKHSNECTDMDIDEKEVATDFAD